MKNLMKIIKSIILLNVIKNNTSIVALFKGKYMYLYVNEILRPVVLPYFAVHPVDGPATE